MPGMAGERLADLGAALDAARRTSSGTPASWKQLDQELADRRGLLATA